jgi:16S rRNA (cytosine967-C5)-methyltransferase
LVEVIVRRRSLSDALEEALPPFSNGRDRALTQELCFGVLRWEPKLRTILERLVARPLRPKDSDIRCLALVGLYQLLYLRIPEHAAVAASVQAARKLGKPWAARLINGLLRGFLRSRAELIEATKLTESAQLAHPPWMIAAIREAWPEHWAAVLKANNERPPLTVRIHLGRTDRVGYCRLLDASGVHGYRLPPHVPGGLSLLQPMDVKRIPGFTEGLVTVQDGAAQLAGPLLDLRAGQRVLDACCAPGGKTTQMLELQPDLNLLALDVDPRRLARVEENLTRLRLHAELRQGDVLDPRTWWNGYVFDRILLDAPCSATGIVRRHPDIKALRKPQDLPVLVERQLRMLDVLWSLLATGGMLVYATCSVLPQENHMQVRCFRARHPDASERVLHVPWGHACSDGRQVLPGEDEMDGFYYARLVKRNGPRSACSGEPKRLRGRDTGKLQ